MTTLVDLRCPAGPKALLARVRAEGVVPHVTSDNLIELACRDCRNIERRMGRSCRMVLHRFDIAGGLIESEVVR